jgi:hypothetical protein
MNSGKRALETTRQGQALGGRLVLIFKMVMGATGIQPVTPSISRKCSPAELRARSNNQYRLLTLSFNLLCGLTVRPFDAAR